MRDINIYMNIVDPIGWATFQYYSYIYISLYKAGPGSAAHVCRWSLEGEMALQCSTLCPCLQILIHFMNFLHL